MNRVTTAILIAGLFASGAYPQDRKRIAILNFDYATVSSTVAQIFGQNQDIGKGLADVLVDRLVNGGVYSVIERKALDKIMAEQNFSNSDRADANSAAKIGRILGVEYMVIGSITQFGRDDKSTNVGGSAVGGITGRFGVGGVRRTNSTAVVAVTARLVNTSTAEILAAATARGQSKRSGTGLLGAGGSSAGQGAGVYDMTSKNFANTIIGEACYAAVSDLARQLESRSSAVPATAIQISGLVADASPDGTVVINVGSRGGVKKGDQLQIKRKIREVRDPATGRVLRSIEEPVGSITIIDVDEASAVGKFSGGQPAKVGDTVSNK
jgi:curli biogenesis system outer membrane secretion channel CsgG